VGSSAPPARWLAARVERHLTPVARDKLVVNMVRGQTLIDIDQAEGLLAAFEAGLGS